MDAGTEPLFLPMPLWVRHGTVVTGTEYKEHMMTINEANHDVVRRSRRAGSDHRINRGRHHRGDSLM
jgi:hypothetical protein